MKIQNNDIAKVLNEIADTLELGGDNPYRIRAYRRASYSINNTAENIADLVTQGKDITYIRHIGAAIASLIKEFVTTGKTPNLSIKKKKYSNQLKRVKGLGPKRISLLHSMNIYTKEELIAAIVKDQLPDLPQLSRKIQQKILANLNNPIPYEKHLKLKSAALIVELLLNRVRTFTPIKKAICAGSYRRRKEVIGNIDILVETSEPQKLLQQFLALDEIDEVVKVELDYAVVILRSGLQITLHCVSAKAYGAALLYATGSSEHIHHLQQLAAQKKFQLNQRGLFQNKKYVSGKTEQEIYQQLGLCYIEPELRENRGEIAASQKNLLPHLIKLTDLRGDLHMHTQETDGTESLATMVQAAMKKGYDYVAITDHSKRLTITNGLDEERLLQQIKLIDDLNSQLKDFTILKSIEVDILEDGSLDLPNWILKELDIRICSIHSKFNLPKDKQTQRIIRAMDNPYFNVLGHPTGRLIFHREPYPLDMEKILTAAKERGCFLELNAQPARLDLNDQYCLMAKKMGVKLAISSDAHSINELDFIQFGIFQARRGWIERQDVINTRKLADLKKILKRI